MKKKHQRNKGDTTCTSTKTHKKKLYFHGDYLRGFVKISAQGD